MNCTLLNPRVPLAAALAEWLETQVKTPDGVAALDHLLVVVPTRQAGRRLRQTLAETLGACIPPRIMLPAHLIQTGTELPEIPRLESTGLLAWFLQHRPADAWPSLFPASGRPGTQTFQWALGISRQLHELWFILEENALLMADVAVQIDTLLPPETAALESDRWQDLARLEKEFFDLVAGHRHLPRPLARRRAVAAPALPEGVETIVLPALPDAQPALYKALENLVAKVRVLPLLHTTPELAPHFDRWGRPDPEFWAGGTLAMPLADDQIIPAENSADQAGRVAGFFAAVPPDEELPALGMADAALFSELQAAFLTRNMVLHNPAPAPLAQSSLGRVMRQLEELGGDPSYAACAAFFREADVLRWLDAGPGLLAELDRFQNKYLPQDRAAMLDALNRAGDGSFTALRRAMARLGELLAEPSRVKRLQRIFQARTLRVDRPGDRELAAAAAVALDMLEEFEVSGILHGLLNAGQRAQLFNICMESASYQLEPGDPSVLLTEGWLELQYNPLPELVITGFNEGAVPDAVTGHAFLPDLLREKFGLTSNRRRLARDAYLLHALLAARAPGAVRLFLERRTMDGDEKKPSRLLFHCSDDTLAARAKRLFTDPPPAAPTPARAFPAAWRLDLPLPAGPPASLSISDFDAYLKSPLGFYLRRILKMEACDDRVKEITAQDFGTFAHAALHGFAAGKDRGSANPHIIREALHTHARTVIHDRYGDALPAVLQLQLRSLLNRLDFVAATQAALRDAGWEVCEAEKKLETTVDGMKITGRADRIDFHKETNTYRIIDFKTGKLPDFTTTAKAAVAHAQTLGLPPLGGVEKPTAWAALQLPLYAFMAAADPRFAGAAIECLYFPIPDAAGNAGVPAPFNPAPFRADLFDTLRVFIRRIQAGLYWPPGDLPPDFAPLVFDGDIEASISRQWLDDQLARCERFNAGL